MIQLQQVSVQFRQRPQTVSCHNYNSYVRGCARMGESGSVLHNMIMIIIIIVIIIIYCMTAKAYRLSHR